MVLDSIKDFLSKPNVSIVGFIAAFVTGNTTFEMLKSFAQNIIIPILGYILHIDQWNHIKFGNIFIGNFLIDLLTWFVIFMIIYFFVEHFLEKFILNETDLASSTYAKKYQANYYKNILTNTGEDIIKNIY